MRAQHVLSHHLIYVYHELIRQREKLLSRYCQINLYCKSLLKICIFMTLNQIHITFEYNWTITALTFQFLQKRWGQSLSLSFFYLFFFMFVCMYACLYVCLYVRLSLCLSVYVCLALNPSNAVLSTFCPCYFCSSMF